MIGKRPLIEDFVLTVRIELPPEAVGCPAIFLE